MKIDLNLLKELRDLTKAPLWDCKKVLVESKWDVQKAKELLKERGILKAWKKWDRETNFWIVKFDTKGDYVVWVKILCETDFVAKNQMFLELVDAVLDKVNNITWEFDDDCSEWDRESIQNFLDENVATIWESMRLGYIFKKSKWTNAYVYNHMWNTIASVVWYDWWEEDKAKAVALQVAAMNPAYISMENIKRSILDDKKNEFLQEMEWSNKPKDIQERIVAGKVHKFFQDDVLLEQSSIVDNTKIVKDFIWEMKIVNIMRVNVG